LLLVHVRVDVCPALIVDGFAVRRAFTYESSESSFRTPFTAATAGASLGPVGEWP